MDDIIILYSFPLRMGVSGIGMTSWNQVNELVKIGVKVILNVGSLEKRIENLSGLNESFRIFGKNIPIKPFGVKRAAKIHDKMTARLILSGKVRIDAVHCWPLGSELTLKAAKKMGIRTFLERPNTHTRYAFEVVKNEYRRLGLKHLKGNTHSYDEKILEIEEREYDLTDYILCPSEFVAKSFRLYGYRDDEIVKHHYGYDPEIFYPSASWEDREDGIRLIFIGRCEPRKGLYNALKAWLSSEACDSGTFYICGAFVKEYQVLLSGMLEHKSIKYLGLIKNVSDVLRKCDALILPSVEEGSALVTYEAMACGNTLLVSDASGAHSEHMKNSLVHKTGDVEELKDHINLIYRDHNLLDSLKKGSIENAAGLTWGKSAEILKKLYVSKS